jgi:hypothetical protein
VKNSILQSYKKKLSKKIMGRREVYKFIEVKEEMIKRYKEVHSVGEGGNISEVIRVGGWGGDGKCRMVRNKMRMELIWGVA